MQKNPEKRHLKTYFRHQNKKRIDLVNEHGILTVLYRRYGTMLKEEKIEEIIFKAMQDFADKNDGEPGWSRDTIEELVLKEGGEQVDVFRAMALGLNMCGIEGYQLGDSGYFYCQDAEVL